MTAGNIIASTVDSPDRAGTVRSFLTDQLGASDATYQMFEKNRAEKTETAFEFQEKAGKAIGCIAEAYDNSWYVIQIVPAKSLEHIMNTSTMQSIGVVGCFIVLFFLYFLYDVGRRYPGLRRSFREGRV